MSESEFEKWFEQNKHSYCCEVCCANAWDAGYLSALESAADIVNETYHKDKAEIRIREKIRRFCNQNNGRNANEE